VQHVGVHGVHTILRDESHPFKMGFLGAYGARCIPHRLGLYRRQRILNCCERSGMHYIAGLARNTRRLKAVAFAEAALKDQYEQTETKQHEVGEFGYAAQTWARAPGDHKAGVR
jgi:hypothetical protein